MFPYEVSYEMKKKGLIFFFSLIPGRNLAPLFQEQTFSVIQPSKYSKGNCLLKKKEKNYV